VGAMYWLGQGVLRLFNGDFFVNQGNRPVLTRGVR